MSRPDICGANKLILNKVEDGIKAGYSKYAPGSGSDIAEYEAMDGIGQQLAQSEEAGGMRNNDPSPLITNCTLRITSGPR